MRFFSRLLCESIQDGHSVEDRSSQMSRCFPALVLYCCSLPEGEGHVNRIHTRFLYLDTAIAVFIRLRIFRIFGAKKIKNLRKQKGNKNTRVKMENAAAVQIAQGDRYEN